MQNIPFASSVPCHAKSTQQICHKIQWQERRLLHCGAPKTTLLPKQKGRFVVPKIWLWQMDSSWVISTQTSLAWSKTARIQLVSLDIHANAQCTKNWVLFLLVFAFLSSHRVVIVQNPACTGQPNKEKMFRRRLKRQKQILLQDQLTQNVIFTQLEWWYPNTGSVISISVLGVTSLWYKPQYKINMGPETGPNWHPVILHMYIVVCR